jgi:hypothetical protein
MMSRITPSVTKPSRTRHLLGALFGERDAQLVRGDQALLHQILAQARGAAPGFGGRAGGFDRGG